MDWQHTQNQCYLTLLRERLKSPLLTWVVQFVEIINNWIEVSPHSKLAINDYGCNVGHFYRGVEGVNALVDYNGFDISETYLKIARENFSDAQFFCLDISGGCRPRVADVSIISATLEHIFDYNAALKNIFDSTKHLVVLRTFVGDQYLSQECLTDGASEKYLIQQFLVDDLIKYPVSNGWSFKIVSDNATGSNPKFVCNGRSILRCQKILVFKHP